MSEVDKSSVCIILLGLPGSGKSSLLGALAQAAQVQSDLLGFTLDCASDQVLDDLQKQTYDNKPQATADETHYPITLQTERKASLRAMLIDTAGQGTKGFRTGKASLEGRTGLPRSLSSADTVLLVVDASAKPAELEADFEELAQILRRLEESRSRRSDIGGLPVYLVLSKCDQLAKKGDSHGKWMERIEESKEEIERRFHDFLAARNGTDRMPFGTIDLHLWATAVKRPPLADRPTRPNEPFGVAELFRQCLVSAQAFEARRRRSHRHMVAAVSGVLGMVLVLGLVAAGFFMSRPSAELAALENAAQALLPRPGASAADRLKEPLEDRLQALTKIETTAGFAKLPAKTREDIKEAKEELEAYLALNKEFLARVQDPRFAVRNEDLARIEKGLDELAVPPEYAAAWADSKLGRRQIQWRKDVAALRRAVGDEEAWVRAQIAAADSITKEGGLVIAKSIGPMEREAWFAKVQDYVERDFRNKRSDRIPDGIAVTFDTVYRFGRVDQARRDWDKAKNKLRKLRELAR